MFRYMIVSFVLFVVSILLAACPQGESFSLGDAGEVCTGAFCPGQAEPDAGPEEPEALPPGAQCLKNEDCAGSSCAPAECVNTICVVKDTCLATFGSEYKCLEGTCAIPPKLCGSTDDSNECTVDICNPATGKVSHVQKSCDDGKPETADLCEPASGDCSHVAVAPSCGNCADDDPCTKDFCDAGACQHFTVVCQENYMCAGSGLEVSCVFQCDAHADCADGDSCTMDACDFASGSCVYEAQNCADLDLSTLDFCEPVKDNNTGKPYTCLHLPTECTGGCDDGNACTTDICTFDMKCAHVAQKCGVGSICQTGVCIPAPCKGTEDCDDEDACTFDFCEVGVCVNDSNVDCGPTGACEVSTGKCLELSSCPSIKAGQEYPCDDGDPLTLDVCTSEGDGCLHAPIVECGPGTVLDPTTNTCELGEPDPECTEGQITCIEHVDLDVFALSICKDGAWQVEEVCEFGCKNGGVGSECLKP